MEQVKKKALNSINFFPKDLNQCHLMQLAKKREARYLNHLFACCVPHNRKRKKTNADKSRNLRYLFETIYHLPECHKNCTYTNQMVQINAVESIVLKGSSNILKNESHKLRRQHSLTSFLC